MWRADGTTGQVPWSETRIGTQSGVPVSAVRTGVTWAWTGRTATAPKGVPGYRAEGLAPEPQHLGCMTVSTDGHVYTAQIVQTSATAQPHLIFRHAVPKPGRSHTILDLSLDAPGADRVICFTSGTSIETDRGPRPVESIRPGDRLWTRDNGYKEVLWAGHRRVSGATLASVPALRPIRVDDGGTGTLVSPHHRLLRVVRPGEEVLLAARNLPAPEARRELIPSGVVYVHLMLDAHQIVRAGGVDSESFHPAAMPLNALDPTQRVQLLDIRPELERTPEDYGPTVRPVAARAG